MGKLRKFIYCIVDDKYLCNRIDINDKQLKEEKDLKKRMKLIDEYFDILGACLWKCRKDEAFINHVYNELDSITNKHKK